MLWFDFCFTALQYILGHFERGQLLYHSVPGQASYAVYQCLVHILSPVTDNCSSWISGRGRMAVEMFSWPSLHERMCRTWGSNSGPLACQVDSLPIKLPCPVYSNASKRFRQTDKQCRPWSDCSLIWIYTICSDLSVQILRIIIVITSTDGFFKWCSIKLLTN